MCNVPESNTHTCTHAHTRALLTLSRPSSKSCDAAFKDTAVWHLPSHSHTLALPLSVAGRCHNKMHVLCGVAISSVVPPPPLSPSPTCTHSHRYTYMHFLPPNCSPLLSSSLCRPCALLSLLLPQRLAARAPTEPQSGTPLRLPSAPRRGRAGGRERERPEEEERAAGQSDQADVPYQTGGVQWRWKQKALQSGDNSRAGVKAMWGCLQVRYWVTVKHETFFYYSLGADKGAGL